MKHKLGVAVVTVFAFFIGGCGGTHTITSTTTTTPSPSAVLCPPGTSFMGCARGVSPVYTTQLRFGAKLGIASGAKFVDVSSYQGHPAWPSIKPYIDGIAAKAGEYTQDQDFYYNAESAHALHLPFAAYEFVRPIGCAVDAEHFIRWIRSVGPALVQVLVLDEEVSGIGGYANCIVPILHRDLPGIPVRVYRSASNNLDGSADNLGCWVAAFGPHTAPSCNGGHPLAWQFASPPYVYFYVPHLGYGDVNVDYGFFKGLTPPGPVCFGKKAEGSKACRRVHSNVRRWEKGLVSSRKVYDRRGCPVLGQRVHYFTRELRQHPRTLVVHRKQALRASRRAYNQRACEIFQQRVTYFGGKIAKDKKTFG